MTSAASRVRLLRLFAKKLNVFAGKIFVNEAALAQVNRYEAFSLLIHIKCTTRR